MAEPYDYAIREGVLELSWEKVGVLARSLAEQLAPHRPTLIVGVARAGLIPAATVAAMLRCNLTPVRLTRRDHDVVVRRHPQWLMDLPPSLTGQRVAVIDEMADSGETLALVAQRCRERGAEVVITASLCAHTWADPAPTHTALLTNALVIFPWDREVYQDGNWIRHPEIEEALRQIQRGSPG